MSGNKRIMTGQVLVRLPETLAYIVRAHAKSANESDATLIRRIIIDALDGDPSEIHPRPRAAPPYEAPPAIVGDLCQAREACGEATGAMVQLARIAREEGLSVHHQELESLIPRMRTLAGAYLDLADEITQHWREHLRSLQ